MTRFEPQHPGSEVTTLPNNGDTITAVKTAFLGILLMFVICQDNSLNQHF